MMEKCSCQGNSRNYGKVRDFIKDIPNIPCSEYPIIVEDNLVFCNSELLSLDTFKDGINDVKNIFDLRYLIIRIVNDYPQLIEQDRRLYDPVKPVPQSLNSCKTAWYKDVLLGKVSYKESLLNNRELLHKQRVKMFVTHLVKGTPSLADYVYYFHNPQSFANDTDFSDYNIPYTKQPKTKQEYLEKGLDMMCRLYYKDINEITLDTILTSVMQLIKEYCKSYNADEVELTAMIMASGGKVIPHGYNTIFFRDRFLRDLFNPFSQYQCFPVIQCLVELYGEDYLSALPSFMKILDYVKEFLDKARKIDLIYSKKMPMNLISICTPVKLAEKMSQPDSLNKAFNLQFTDDEDNSMFMDSVLTNLKSITGEFERLYNSKCALENPFNPNTDLDYIHSMLGRENQTLSKVYNYLCNMVIVNKTVKRQIDIDKYLDYLVYNSQLLDTMLKTIEISFNSIDIDRLNEYSEALEYSNDGFLRMYMKSLRIIYNKMETIMTIYKENPITW